LFLFEKVSLVFSVSGYQGKETMDSYGYLRLRSVLSSKFEPSISVDPIRDHVIVLDDLDSDAVDDRTISYRIHPMPEENNLIYYQTSSIGAILRYNWFQEEFLPSVSAEKNRNPTMPEQISSKQEKSLPSSIVSSTFRIVYPTTENVLSSTMDGCTMVCLQEEHWYNKEIPRELLCELVPSNKNRSKILLHSKILFRRIVGEVSSKKNASNSHSSTVQCGWCYIGSHNFSSSAWGRLQKNGSSFHMANYELGVLFVDSKPPLSNNGPDHCCSMRWLSAIPFECPPRIYTASEKPWIVSQHRF